MGRFNTTPSPKMNHFSHPHDLQLWNFHTQITNPSLALCSCCKLPPYDLEFEPMYLCTACNFFLHLSCAQYPQLISHPSHKNHTLTLLPIPAYPVGAFNCDACNRQGNGFSYHCSSCEYDLHVKCASRPFTITHQFHSCPLELTFKNPYENAKGFSCDICHKIGFKEWLYRCSACEFDVHLDCTLAAPVPAVVPGSQAQFLHGGGSGSVQNPGVSSAQFDQVLLNRHQLTHSASMCPNSMAHHQFLAGNVASVPVVHGQLMRPNFVHSASTGESSLMSSVIEGLVEGSSQGVGQGLVQGMIGGGGGGDGLGSVFGDSSGSQHRV